MGCFGRSALGSTASSGRLLPADVGAATAAHRPSHKAMPSRSSQRRNFCDQRVLVLPAALRWPQKLRDTLARRAEQPRGGCGSGRAEHLHVDALRFERAPWLLLQQRKISRGAVREQKRRVASRRQLMRLDHRRLRHAQRHAQFQFIKQRYVSLCLQLALDVRWSAGCWCNGCSH